MSGTEKLVVRLPNDIGGLPADFVERTDHELEPWEKRCHALADVLDFHKIINTEEKRRGVEALGAEMVGKLTYYERWIVAFANTPLMQAAQTAGIDLLLRALVWRDAEGRAFLGYNDPSWVAKRHGAEVETDRVLAAMTEALAAIAERSTTDPAGDVHHA